MDDPILVYEQDGIAQVVLNRPQKRNALTYEMWVRLAEIFGEFRQRPALRAVVIRGAGGQAFSAGADISEFGERRADPETAKTYHLATDGAVMAIRSLPCPTIARIEGYCVGGGAELAVACDLRFAAEGSRLGITPAKLGIIYGLLPTAMLVELVGPSRAKDLLFSGRLLDAREAYQIGLVDRVWPGPEMADRLDQYLQALVNNAPNSIAGAKSMINRVASQDLSHWEAWDQMAIDSVKSPQYQEGVRAFMGKRTPEFPALQIWPGESLPW